jgi:hypothetical protein
MCLQWHQQEQHRECCRRHDGLKNRLACLPPNLRQHFRIIYLLFAIVHVAQTAQREANSGFLTVLEHSRQAAIQQREQDQSPGAIRADGKQHDGDHGGDDQSDDATPQASLSLVGADVGNANIG